MLATFDSGDEISNKGYVAPPIKKRKEEEKTISVPKYLLEGLPVKNAGKRKKRTRLDIYKDANKLKKKIR